MFQSIPTVYIFTQNIPHNVCFKITKEKKELEKKRRKPFVQEIPLLHHLITTVEKCC